MEADWEIEIGGSAPIIESAWSGFTDLRIAPERSEFLQEIASLPALAPSLVRLNSPGSGFFTVKCDVWPVTGIDPFEFDTDHEHNVIGIACYIDLLPCSSWLWPDLSAPKRRCAMICVELRSSTLRCCRADLVLRRAKGIDHEQKIGITAYIAGCGATEEEARRHLGDALSCFVDAAMRSGSDTGEVSKLQSDLRASSSTG